MPSDPTPPNGPNQPGKQRRRPAPGLGGNWLVVAIILFVVGLLWWGSTMNPSSSLTWGDFIALINHEPPLINSQDKPESDKPVYEYLHSVTFVGTSTVTGDVKVDALPPDLKNLADKLKGGHFTVHRFQANQDQDLQNRLNQIQEAAIKSVKAEAEKNPNGPPAQPPFRWDQQEDWNSGIWGTILVFLTAAAGDRGVVLLHPAAPGFRDPHWAAASSSNYIKSPAKPLRAATATASPSTTWPGCIEHAKRAARNRQSSCADPQK